MDEMDSPEDALAIAEEAMDTSVTSDLQADKVCPPLIHVHVYQQ